MESKRITVIATTAFIALAAGCAKSPPETAAGDAGAGITVCTEPRPEVCTMEYDPVCAHVTDGRRKTYANACSACSDPLVTGHELGACPSAN